MKRHKITTAVAASLMFIATGVFAQHQGHHPTPAPTPAPPAKPKAPAKSKAPAKPRSNAAKTEPAAPVDHSKMNHSTTEHSSTDGSPRDPAAQPATVDHSHMDHSQMQHPKAAGQLVTPIPELTDADRVAARAPEHDHPVHDNTVHSMVLFNRLEGFDSDDESGMEWEGQGWIGTDTDRLWLRSEGERKTGRTESADLEALYGRPISPWWDVVAGVRHDFKPGESQDWLAIGLIGLAPYKFEVEATAYIGASGRTAARVEAEYELLLTNRWILQPLVELNFNGKSDQEREIGSGLSTAEAGLRLRYEVTRRFAPYVGIVYERAFGGTEDFRRAHGEDAGDMRVVAGARVWF